MTDEEKAEKYLEPIHRMYSCNNEHYTDEVIIQAHIDGLAEGRKEKWHDLRKDPNDLPKENVQIVFYIKEYFKSIEKYKNHYCLGVYKKSFLNDDVKLYVERSKGYECEHSTEDVLYWCELPEFKE